MNSLILICQSIVYLFFDESSLRRGRVADFNVISAVDTLVGFSSSIVFCSDEAAEAVANKKTFKNYYSFMC